MKSSTSSDAAAGGAAGKAKLILIGVVAVLVLGAILYFVGLQAGRAQLADQAAKFGVERNGLQSQVKTAETARDAARDRAAMMEARAAGYRTAIDLDARNFGTANTHLKEAGAALGRVTKPGTESLRGEIEGTDLNVAVNLSGQRAKVLDFADQLNKMMPVEIEMTAPTATASMPEDGQSESVPSQP